MTIVSVELFDEQVVYPCFQENIFSFSFHRRLDINPYLQRKPQLQTVNCQFTLCVAAVYTTALQWFTLCFTAVHKQMLWRALRKGLGLSSSKQMHLFELASGRRSGIHGRPGFLYHCCLPFSASVRDVWKVGLQYMDYTVYTPISRKGRCNTRLDLQVHHWQMFFYIA